MSPWAGGGYCSSLVNATRDFSLARLTLDANDYSVDPIAVGRRVEVVADLAKVQARWNGRVVADHARV